MTVREANRIEIRAQGPGLRAHKCRVGVGVGVGIGIGIGMGFGHLRRAVNRTVIENVVG